jgi:hypothetical protein
MDAFVYGPFINRVHFKILCKRSKYFNAMNSVHFCSITLRSNQMHYFYYLKHGTVRTQHGLINRQTRRQAAETTHNTATIDAG